MLLGMRGNDTLDGGAGGDVLNGGKGNDAYVVDSGLDIVDEYRGTRPGSTTVLTSFSLSLADAARCRQIENLTLLNVATALDGDRQRRSPTSSPATTSPTR